MYYNEKINYVDKKGEFNCQEKVEGYWVKRCVIIWFKELTKKKFFKTEDNKEKYIELLKKYYKEFKIDIIAYCIMDNHVHMLLYANDIKQISNFMKNINSIYAMYYNKKNR